MTNDIITLISVLISGTSVFVAMATLLIDRHQNRLALGATFLRELEKEFLWSQDMRERRLVIAQFLRKNNDSRKTPPVEVAHLLDWMDQVGLYSRRGVIDLEMTWTTLFYWYAHYWVLLEAYAKQYEARGGGIAFYQNAHAFYKKLYQFGERHKGLPSADIYFSQERLLTFIDVEIAQCSGEIHNKIISRHKTRSKKAG